MNKTFKIITIIAAGLVGVGILMVGLTFAFGMNPTHLFDAIKHKNISSMDQTVKEELQGFQSISVDTNYQEIILKEGERFHIAYSYNSEYSKLSHEIKNGTLTVTEERKDKNGLSNDLLDIINGKEGGGVIEITYPKQTIFRDVRIVSDMGEVEAEDLSSSNLQVDVDLGSIDLKEVNVQTLQVRADAGNVLLSEGSVDRAELELDLGSLETKNWNTKGLVAVLSGGEADLNGVFLGETNIDCDLGNIVLQVLDSRENYSYDVDVDLGTIYVDGKKIKSGSSVNKNVENKIDLNAGAGDIKLNFEPSSQEN
ncbi:MAG: DUF4097 family beta strand repeat-containing protein [Anaerovorax sp.]|nr:DUF4097 family beta strand repeat-containing protein [Anaerovorax sp.]